MDSQLPFWNFSLKRVVDREPDSLKRARIRIVLVTLVLTLLKLVIGVPLVVHGMLDHQLHRSIFIFVMFAFLTKYVLWRPQHVLLVSHIIILSGLFAIWTSVVIYGQVLNLLTVQFVFMVTFVGYYLINNRFAVVYSVVAIAPVMMYLVANHDPTWRLDRVPQGLPSPGFEIIALMNFSTMVYIHYLFYRAFKDNIAEKEELNKQLEATIAETKALAESRSVFLSTMSHELRTPLNAVIGMANLVMDTATKEQAENLDILEFSANSLLTLVNDILDYNKGENGKIELEAIPVNLTGLIHGVCSGLQHKAKDKGFQLVMDVDEQLKGQWVITDPTRLTQIIYNLAGNAIKFTEEGSVTVHASVVSEDFGTLKVRFYVADTGIGIAPQRQQAIFDPFVQASSDTTRHYGGTGLGLAIVKRLLKLFNTDILLESVPGEGSVFSFEIAFESYLGAVKPVSSKPVSMGTLPGLNILIAEDNPINALLINKLLSKWEVTAVVTRNGQEAVEQVSSHTFDGVLMDLHMPVMDGYNAALAIRAMSDPIKAGLPIIALTASVAINVYDKINAAGMNDYLSKPFQPAALYQKLSLLHATKLGSAMTG
ncbi:response regulator [Mucilaginibacter terrenus]|uniref:histidine kinase n=1 Tax=Mucilaginibacter terrenus TaxID=2482727 RepID=A0A3E2NQD9_9SPHI|nr:ATP-binding protein [Mucilaginibacter terrenus]RFZ83214.1 response regulator [Mucilaginibacter terrenus]